MQMPVTVVVGGFFGDEGKGKIVSYLALRDGLDLAVRVGSVNAGHTVILDDGRVVKLRMLPSAFTQPSCRLLIGAGANVNPSIFLSEVEATGTKGRVGLDPQCSIIEEEHIERDRRDAHLSGRVQTTGQGVGPAVEDRVRRAAKLARDVEELKPFLVDVALETSRYVEEGRRVLLEGTQGCFLSLYHGTYPYVTARDTTAAAVCSEVGVGPTKVDEVMLVFKAYVTRVGGGPLPGELPREEAERRGWVEVATVTGRMRRAAPFNFELAKRAVMLNGATSIAITKLDSIYPSVAGARRWEELSPEARRFVEKVEEELKVKVALLGTGPRVFDVVDLRSS